MARFRCGVSPNTSRLRSVGMGGEPAEKVERAVRDAIRDVAALWYLFVEVNMGLLREKRTLALLLLS